MKAPLSYVPALLPAAGMVAGIILGESGLGIGTTAAGIAAFIILYLLKKPYVAFGFLMTSVGALLYQTHQPSTPPPDFYDKEHTMTAKILSVQEHTTTVSYIARLQQIDGESADGINAKLTVQSVANIKNPGTEVKFKATPYPIESITDLPGEIDYTKYLKAEGITVRCNVWTAMQEIQKPSDLETTLNHLRKDIYNSIVCAPIDSPTASFLVATILGDQTLLPEETMQDYRTVGVAHILALSGLHVGVIATMLMLLLFPLQPLTNNNLLRPLITITIVWLYAMVAGFSPSIVRAGVMITVFIIASRIQRGYNAYNSLFLSIIIMLAINPGWLKTPGFQLSVSAVASILMFGTLTPMTLKRKPLLYYTVNAIVIPVSAMLGTGIVSAYYFNMLPLMFLFSNIICGVLFPWILGGGIILALFTGCGINFTFGGHVIDFLYSLMSHSIGALAKSGSFTIEGIYFSAWAILPYAIALIFAAFALRQHKRYQWVMTVTMLVMSVIVADSAKTDAPRAELYIPRTPSSTKLIFRQGDKALLYSNATAANHDTELTECNSRYKRFLLSRGCGTSFERSTRGDTNTDYFKLAGPMVAACDKTIYIIDGTSSTDTIRRKADYALVVNGFKGKIDDITAAVATDTILIGPDVHPSRRGRLLRESVGKIKCIDIKKEGFSIVWQ